MSKTYYDYAEVDWEQKYLDLDTGVRMAYYECGPKDGKTVLLIHGVTDGCVAWAQIAPVLEKAGCHCYIVEYRGNGMTDKPDMGPFGYTGELLADDIIDFIEKLDLQENTSDLISCPGLFPERTDAGSQASRTGSDPDARPALPGCDPCSMQQNDGSSCRCGDFPPQSCR